MIKRIFDIIVSFIGITLLIPVFLIISLFILLDSKGGIFYLQPRVGRYNIDFSLFKFRTMQVDSDKKGLLTVGSRDNRITKTGYVLRKYKLDELPQLFNVLIGTMSLVGPRPEVRKYVELYNEEQKKILNVRPGITDYASIEYFNENDLLAKSTNPEQTYINEILPAKIELNKLYLNKSNLVVDLSIIWKTVLKILR